MIIKLNNDKTLSVTKKSTVIYDDNYSEQIVLYLPNEKVFNINFTSGMSCLNLRNETLNIYLKLDYICEYNGYYKFVADITNDITTNGENFTLQYIYADAKNELLFHSFEVVETIVNLIKNTTKTLDKSVVQFDRILSDISCMYDKIVELTKLNVKISEKIGSDKR